MRKSFIFLILMITAIYPMSIWKQRFRNQNKPYETEVQAILNKIELDEKFERLNQYEYRMQQEVEKRNRSFDQERRTVQEINMKRQRLIQSFFRAHFGGSSVMTDFLPYRYI
jgi:hypothetical protein